MVLGISDKKISVVVPMYNSAKTIERCIYSLLNQTYRNIEIIVVDDGSKDTSLEICKVLQKIDTRIVLISGKNAGVSVARNKGIEIATGDYIAFVDSDDYVKPKMYEKLITIAEEQNVALVFCNYIEATETGKKRIVDQFSQITNANNSVENIVIIEHMLQAFNANNIFGSCWRTLINIDLLKENSIKFTPGISMTEDLKFMLECLGATSNSGICKDALYYFLTSDNSTTSKYMKNQDRDMETVNLWIKEFVKGPQSSKDLQVYSQINMANALVVNAANVCANFSPFSMRERVLYVKKKREQLDYKLALKIAVQNRKNIGKNRLVQMSLLHFHFDFLVILFHSLKNKNFKKYVAK